jgi:hypothetical protein
LERNDFFKNNKKNESLDEIDGGDEKIESGDESDSDSDDDVGVEDDGEEKLKKDYGIKIYYLTANNSENEKIIDIIKCLFFFFFKFIF